ncbi:MAG TPA: DUF1440 domain-containing protein [Gemmatimonadales bacterium]|nr:DUF1440 domain-containing protein [Gemmatimonadales bacterium]
MRIRRSASHGIGEDLVKGAIAGAVATWVMGKVTDALYQRENRWARRREDDARSGKTSYGVLAEKAAGAMGETLDDESRERYGAAAHWALGVGAGAIYAVLRRRLQGLGRTAGVGFGTVFWAAVDEGLVPALGLTPGPRAFPWQTHARGLAGHLTFGTITDGTLRLLDAVA